MKSSLWIWHLLKPQQNKKGQAFVGMLGFLILFLADD